MSKTIEPQSARRASYIEPHPDEAPQVTGKIEPLTEPSEELKQTIAETRAAQVAELQAKLDAAEHLASVKQEAIDSLSQELAEVREAMTKLKATPNGVDTQVYNYVPEGSDGGEDTGYTVVQIDTEGGTGKIKVYVNDGVVYEGDPERDEKDADLEESAASTFFRVVEGHLSTHEQGAQAILKQVESRSPVERAAYLASIERIFDAMQQNTDNLRDLHHRSQIAAAMVSN